MRSHSQIIAEAGGYKALAERLELPVGRVRFWERRKSIPVDSWRQLETAKVATVGELLDAAERAAAERHRVHPEAAA